MPVVQVSSLQEWEKNPREISEEKLEALKKYIKKYGLLTPLLVDGRDKKTVLGGNMRLRALKELGIEKVEVKYVYPKNDDEAVEIALLDNAHFGRFIKKKLKKLVDGLEIRLDEVTVSLDEIDIYKLRRRAGTIALTRFDKGEPFTRSGDVWVHDEFVVVCGDSTQKEYWKILDTYVKNKFKLTLTSPPYGIGIDYRSHQDKTEGWKEMVLQVLKNAWMRTRGWMMVNLSYGKRNRVGFLDVFYEISHWDGVNFKDMIVWHKRNAMPVSSVEAKILAREWEPILVVGNEWEEADNAFDEETDAGVEFVGVWDDGSQKYRSGVAKLKNYWSVRGPLKQNRIVPAAFPLPLVERAILMTTRVGDWVVDPFLGGGTTVVGALNKKRRGAGIEIDPLTVDFAIMWIWKTFRLAPKLIRKGKEYNFDPSLFSDELKDYIDEWIKGTENKITN